MIDDHSNPIDHDAETSDGPPRSPDDSTITQPTPRPALDMIGPYKILETLGEGGMGVVYLAEQTEPIQRRVAVKVIKLGMDSRQVIARFQAERQALAMMDHPNVARVIDAGISDDGRPYFVMEHVPGVPITEHCDLQRLSIDERLNLFMQVCDAVQHAHQKGIIHRDLKPGNVLVSVKEGTPTVKVIDFGVAKALHQKLTERSLFTEQGQLVGTPEYMSPEQAEMTAQDIDTRSDIYSLGVLLYELLTGALPFDPGSLRKAAFAEIQRIIREEEPPRPSTKLSSLGDESTTHAQKCSADPRSLLRELRGDLDWITMKALEKDRARRYAAASEFAADIQRHLNDEVVLARPQRAWHHARKRLRKRRGLYSTACIAVAAAAFTATQFWVQADRMDQETHITGNYADQLAEAQRYSGLLADIALELGLRRGRLLEALSARLAEPPESPAAFASDETIAEAVTLLNRFFFVRSENLGAELRMAERYGGPKPVQLLSTLPEVLQAAVALDSPEAVAAELERSRPDDFEQVAKEYLELAIETVRRSTNVSATRGILGDSGRSATGRQGRKASAWPIVDLSSDRRLNNQSTLPERWSDPTYRPKDMDMEELIFAHSVLIFEVRLSGFMAGMRLNFPWFWDTGLLVLAILAGVFGVTAVAIRFFV